MGRRRPGARRGSGHRRGRGKAAVRRSPTLAGTLRVTKPGVATVETAEGSFRVARRGLREAMNGDEVTVSVFPARGGEKVALVQGVITRAQTTFLGRFELAGPLGAVVPLDARLGRDFFVVPEDTSPARLGVGEGDVVVARIAEYPRALRRPRGRSVLGCGVRLRALWALCDARRDLRRGTPARARPWRGMARVRRGPHDPHGRGVRSRVGDGHPRTRSGHRDGHTARKDRLRARRPA